MLDSPSSTDYLCQIHENILSAAEAVDSEHVMLLTHKGPSPESEGRGPIRQTYS